MKTSQNIRKCRVKSSRMQHRVIPDVSKDEIYSIFRVKHSKRSESILWPHKLKLR